MEDKTTDNSAGRKRETAWQQLADWFHRNGVVVLQVTIHSLKTFGMA